jgi:hypothetical protein
VRHAPSAPSRRRGLHGFRVLCAVALLAFGVGGASAGSLTIFVSEPSGPQIPIVDNGAFDANFDIGVINVTTNVLNILLNNTAFTSLGASSDQFGFGNGLLTVTGAVKTTRLLDPASVSIQVSDIDIYRPTGPSGALFSSTSNTYLNASSGTQKFTSWFNVSDILGGKELASPVVTLTSTTPDPNSHAGDATPTPVSLTGLYGLTNEVDITLFGGTFDDPAQILFTGVTRIAAATSPESAIPEPATLTVVGVSGMSLCGWRWLKRKRPRAVP